MRFAKSLLLFIFLLLVHTSMGQSATSQIEPGNVNIKYLEHLVKTKVDAVRKAHDCKPLINDSILYIAAQHHASYMVENNRLSHFENDKAQFKTPQNRAVYYGAVNYSVGENVLKTTANATVKNKKGKKYNTNTYEGLANSIVDGWVNSPGHFKNIIKAEYQITGLAITEKDGKIYACQKFATVQYKFEFEEPAAMFSYSNYKSKPVAKSFAGIQAQLIPHKYEWRLKHDKLEKCESCNELVKFTPFITLRQERGNFILRVENSAYLQQLIQDKKDGLAVEIVTYNDYACGNPAYYTEPSRRNGQLKTNGRILKPVYKKDLLKGFKKRKRKKNMRFLPFLFGADSIKFKNRISQFKMAKYDSEYFEMKIGKVPKNINGLYAHNLLYIQENQICHVDYFTGYCGELYNDSAQYEFIPLDTSGGTYPFEPEKRVLDLTIPFEQNKSNYTANDIEQFTHSINDLTYSIDSIYIQAFSSIEGDSVKNVALQNKRAESIVAALTKNQLSEVPIKIETKNSWDHFYKTIRRFPAYRQLATQDKAAVSKFLQNGKVLTDLEPLFKKERKALVKIHLSIYPQESTYNYLIEKEFKKLQTEIDKTRPESDAEFILLLKLESLYTYTHKRVVQEKAPVELLASQTFPMRYFKAKERLAQKFILYGEQFPEAFAKNTTWVNQKDAIRRALTFERPTLLHLYPEFIYYDCYEKTRKIEAVPGAMREEVQAVFNTLIFTSEFYRTDTVAKKNIDALYFTLNMTLLNEVFPGNPSEASADAGNAIAAVYKFYSEKEQLTDTLTFKLAKMAVFYGNVSQAYGMNSLFPDNLEMLAYNAVIGFDHPSTPGMEPYYQHLIAIKEILPADVWCNLFINNCKIPFQAFDHEELRNSFCETCQGRNEFLNENSF
ncbi:MAG: hypothetical protein GQ574_12835 [Crocinitomix sp.]|nr:hypothetical protein [Crocinitomix sp.]